MSDNLIQFSSDFIQPVTVEQVTLPNLTLRKLTFPGGFTCFTHTGQLEAAMLYNEIIIQQAYFQNGLSVEGARCVFDVGANIGIFTMSVKRQAPDAAVFAFEPDPQAFQALEMNIRAMGCTGVQMFNLAVGQAGGEAPPTYYPSMTSPSAALPDIKLTQSPGPDREAYLSQAQPRAAQQRTLSSVFHERGIAAIDYLRIDAAGAETAVLASIEEEHWPMIRQVAVAAHSPQLGAQVHDYLSRRGFAVFGSGSGSAAGDAIVYARRG